MLSEIPNQEVAHLVKKQMGYLQIKMTRMFKEQCVFALVCLASLVYSTITYSDDLSFVREFDGTIVLNDDGLPTKHAFFSFYYYLQNLVVACHLFSFPFCIYRLCFKKIKMYILSDNKYFFERLWYIQAFALITLSCANQALFNLEMHGLSGSIHAHLAILGTLAYILISAGLLALAYLVIGCATVIHLKEMLHWPEGTSCFVILSTLLLTVMFIVMYCSNF